MLTFNAVKAGFLLKAYTLSQFSFCWQIVAIYNFWFYFGLKFLQGTDFIVSVCFYSNTTKTKSYVNVKRKGLCLLFLPSERNSQFCKYPGLVEAE